MNGRFQNSANHRALRDQAVQILELVGRGRFHFKIGVLTIVVGLGITFAAPKIGLPGSLLSICIIAGGIAMARIILLTEKK